MSHAVNRVFTTKTTRHPDQILHLVILNITQ